MRVEDYLWMRHGKLLEDATSFFSCKFFLLLCYFVLVQIVVGLLSFLSYINWLDRFFTFLRKSSKYRMSQYSSQMSLLPETPGYSCMPLSHTPGQPCQRLFLLNAPYWPFGKSPLDESDAGHSYKIILLCDIRVTAW